MKIKWLTATGKPFGFILLLLSTQLLAGQRATAKNTFGSQTDNFIVSAEASSGTQAQSPSAICPAQLGDAIDAVTNRPQFARSRWGILIQKLSSSDTLYARDRSRYFIPASNVKLFTTAAALRQLGPQFRIRTSVYSASADPNVKSLRLVGRGDPSLTDAQLTELAQQLKRQGYQQVQQLLVSDGYFKGSIVNPSWEWGDLQANYGAPVNSLILNQNAVGLTILPQALGRPLRLGWDDPIGGSGWQLENNTVTSAPGSQASLETMGFVGKPVLRVTGQLPVGAEPNTVSLAVLDPAEYFLRHLQAALALQQINVTQARVVSSPETGNQRELAAVESPPLAALLMETNQNSNNLYAEALLRSLGATKTGAANVSPVQNSASEGLAVVKQTLTALGVDPKSYILADGSGLSRHNLVTPDAIAQTLKAMAQSPTAEAYRASLPVAGVSGTLQNRFRNTPAQGILQAKTGTMSGVVALSGYLNPPGYQPLVVSIIANQSDLPAATTRQAIDEIVLLLTRLHRC
ncbi:MAG: D-alanyl-D-alanine carboxypeptidase/D-alanyl-D-alanine-endopeptidase [Aphanothece sp. CMT-3BRIN-NPC111]|jgi:D-alanyl-D-alanine carboxypeptidase/D-alanyl-D-alanine-endopeptidase (penicillin-binding protein 4)|nr:D-alanyl-D-alanine carboxypeptidase/D-alanyl-D-alanine-endopeptidase [Aphanothece sp. CMT-3BRIN-NPC111]